MTEATFQQVARFVPSLYAIRNWLVRLFAPKPLDRPAPVPASVPEPEPEPAPPVIQPAKKPRAAKRSATQSRPNPETLADLLENLDESFGTMAIPEIKGNWLPKKDIKALHKLGIYVPTPWQMETSSDPRIPAGTPLPMLASSMLLHGKYDTPDNIHPRFVFAFKEARLPPECEQIAGTPYRFGYCVQLAADEKDKTSPPRMFWLWAWVVVKQDGRLAVCHERRKVVHKIMHRRVVNGSRSSNFSTQQWCLPTMFTHEDSSRQDGHNHFLMCAFRQLVLWWTSRDERWSVGVRKDGRRVTFSIQPDHTAAYFADREKTVTDGGKTKRIIHFVREHQRSTGATVKAHVRGLRAFNWRGFACSVTAPKLNGAIFTNCPLEPVDEEDMNPNAAYMTTLEVATSLAQNEDFPPKKAA